MCGEKLLRIVERAYFTVLLFCCLFVLLVGLSPIVFAIQSYKSRCSLEEASSFHLFWQHWKDPSAGLPGTLQIFVCRQEFPFFLRYFLGKLDSIAKKVLSGIDGGGVGLFPFLKRQASCLHSVAIELRQTRGKLY